jgi:Tfp pilus assembly protein PilX
MIDVQNRYSQQPYNSKMYIEASMHSTLGLYRKQQGATLIVALIFLLILTAAGITAVKLSTTSERMASNSQFRGASFQLAQSEINAQRLSMNGNIANRAPLQLAMNKALEPKPRFPDRRQALSLAAQVSAPNLSQTSSVNSLGNVDCITLGDGTSAEHFTCNQFELSTRSTLTSGAYSEQVGGLVMSTPK